jgi:hypothetical protein
MSVVVSLVCAGGGNYQVWFGNSMALGSTTLTGTCDGTHELAWPITERTAMTLTVAVPAGVTWRATPTFSTAPFVDDTVLASDCKEFAAVDSEFMNADGGYRAHAIDAAEWTARVEKATKDLQALAVASRSRIHDALTQLHALIEDAHPRIGDASFTMDSGSVPGQTISNACNANQTPLVLTGEFGG